MAALLFGLQSAEFDKMEADQKARAELLDWRGRFEWCELYKDDSFPEWNCGDLARDKQVLKTKYGIRPDLLELLELDSHKHEKTMWLEAGHSKPVWTKHAEHLAFDQQGRPYFVSVSADEDDFLKEFSIRLPGRKDMIVVHIEDRMRNAVIQSLQLDSNDETLFLRMNFGALRPWCFDDRGDGQPRIELAFNGRNDVDVWRTDYVGCEPRTAAVSHKVELKNTVERAKVKSP